MTAKIRLPRGDRCGRAPPAARSREAVLRRARGRTEGRGTCPSAQEGRGRTAAERVQQELGGADILVNKAGLMLSWISPLGLDTSKHALPASSSTAASSSRPSSVSEVEHHLPVPPGTEKAAA